MEFFDYSQYYFSPDDLCAFLDLRNLSFDVQECTKFPGRDIVFVTYNGYETVLCPMVTMNEWFCVTKTRVGESHQDKDIHEFAKNDYDGIYNFIMGSPETNPDF